jgi:hypothetical protein
MSGVLTVAPTRPRRDAAIGRLRDICGSPSPVGAGNAVVPAAPAAAESIAATVGTAVDRAMGALAPYGSRGDQFAAECEIEHRDVAGSVTRARMTFRFEGGSRR